MVNDVLIGYDVREMYLPEIDPWPDAPRRNSFLRRDVGRVLAMDRYIWPSIFRPNFMIIGGAPMPDTPNIEIPLQNTNHNLWYDLGDMRAEVAAKADSIPKPCWMIAITEGMDDEDKAQWLHPPSPHIPYPFVPNKINPEWQFLGYDVVYDSGLWSALSGVRFGADEIDGLREKWGEHLNEHHLFIEQEKALQYAEWADEDPGHAPHLVYGLYLIERLEEK